MKKLETLPPIQEIGCYSVPISHRNMKTENTLTISYTHDMSPSDKNIENCKRILEYFEANEHENKIVKEVSSIRIPFKGGLKDKIRKIKVHMKNPTDIIDEIKAKYDLYQRLKDKNKEESSPDKDKDHVTISTNNMSTSASGHIKKHFVSKTTMKSKKQLEATKTFISNTITTNFLNKLEEDNKKLDFSENSMSPFKKTKQYKDFLRVNELTNMITKSKTFDNNLLQNFINNLALNFPNIYEQVKFYLKMDSDRLNSENKQIQLFLIVLDIFKEKSLTVKSDEDKNIKCICILDNLFHDFCAHISISSTFRSEFLQQIWLEKSTYTESILVLLKEEIDKLVNKNEEIKKILNSSYETNQKVLNDLEAANKTIVNFNIKYNEKESELFDLKIQIRNLEKELEERNRRIGKLLSKVNSPKECLLDKKVKFNLSTSNEESERSVPLDLIKEEDDIRSYNGIYKRDTKDSLDMNTIKKEILEIDSKIETNPNIDKFLNRKVKFKNSVIVGRDSKSSTDIIKVLNFNQDKLELERKLTNLSTTKLIEVTDKDDDKPVDPLNLDINELVKSRQKRATFSNAKNFKTKLTEKKPLDNFTSRKEKIIEESVLNIEKDARNITGADKNRRQMQFQLYLNKGINLEQDKFKEFGAQTDISNADLNELLSNKNKSIEHSSKLMTQHIHDLHASFTQIFNLLTIKNEENHSLNHSDSFRSSANNSVTHHHTNFNLNEYEQTLKQAKILTQNVSECNTDVLNGIQKVLGECDLIVKDNENLREKVVNLSETIDDLKETYQDIFNVLVRGIGENNEDLASFLNNYQTKKLNSEMVFDFFNKIIERNYNLIEKDQKTIFNLIPNVEVKHGLIKEEFMFLQNKKEFDENGKAILKKGNNISKELILDFLNRKTQIKTINNWKKTLKIVDAILFDWIEKMYFKKDKMNFDVDEVFLDFAEVPFVYFNNQFGLEALAKKKFSEFLQCLVNYNPQHKRIQLLYRLAQLNKTEKSEIKYMSVFVIRQLILIIQQFKSSGCLIRNHLGDDDFEKAKIGLQFARVPEIVQNLLIKLPYNSDLKAKVNLYFEKNKITVSKNMRNYVFYDFDDFIDFYTTILLEIESYFTKYLRTIFNAVDVKYIY